MTSARKSVLVVEDDQDSREAFALSLRMAGFEVRCAADGVEALRLLDAARPDAIVTDLLMQGVNGFALLEEIQDIPVVVVTGSPIALSHPQISAILRKPVPPDLVVAAVRNALVQMKKKSGPRRPTA